MRAVAFLLVAMVAVACSSKEPRDDRPLHSSDYRELPPGAQATGSGASSTAPAPTTNATTASQPDGGFAPPGGMKRAGRWISTYSPSPGYEVRVWQDAWDGKLTRCHYKGGVLVLIE